VIIRDLRLADVGERIDFDGADGGVLLSFSFDAESAVLKVASEAGICEHVVDPETPIRFDIPHLRHRLRTEHDPDLRARLAADLDTYPVEEILADHLRDD
jgi:hypothetical protein